MPIKIRYANKSEVDAIQNIIQKEFGFQFRKTIEDRISKKRIFIAESDSEIAGILVFGAKLDQILDLLIVEKFRGQGVGKRLFTTGVHVTKTKGLRILATGDLTGKKRNSTEFWRKMGFNETGRVRVTKGGYRLVEMTWGYIPNFLTYKL